MKISKHPAAARRLGLFLNPFVIFTALFALVAAVTTAYWWSAVLYLGLELLAAGSVGIFLLYWTASKKASDFWLAVREERKVPAMVLLAASLILQLTLVVFGAPVELVFLMGSMLVTALILALVTIVLKAKASAHAAVAAHAAVWGMAVLGVGGLIFVVAAPLVMWARVAEDRHTPAQVVVGAGVGAAVAAVGVWSA